MDLNQITPSNVAPTDEIKVRDFFNYISEDYTDKYKTKSLFSTYFFNQRLEKATKNINFKNTTILDIGAGTGTLYDYILHKEKNIRYLANDVAEGMLNNSNIPIADRYTGKCYEVDFAEKTFDLIFMLGVTTYLNEEELKKNLNFIKNHLTDNGQAIITFTNKQGIDTKMRLGSKFLLKRLKNKQHVIAQEFDINCFKLSEAKKLIAPDFELNKVEFLNHTVFPFNLLFPKLSIKAANTLEKRSERVKQQMSSDFILFLKKKSYTRK